MCYKALVWRFLVCVSVVVCIVVNFESCMYIRVGQHHVILSMMFPDKCSYRYTVYVFSLVLYPGCCERVGITASTGDEQGRS